MMLEKLTAFKWPIMVAHTLHKNKYHRDPPLTHSHSLTLTHTHTHTHTPSTACPEGLDWDGASCNLMVEEDDASDAFHWSIMGRWQTLIFMLLASFVVMVASLLALRARSANKSRTFGLNLNLRDKRRFVNSRTFRTPLVNRVEDLVPKPLL